MPHEWAPLRGRHLIRHSPPPGKPSPPGAPARRPAGHRPSPLALPPPRHASVADVVEAGIATVTREALEAASAGTEAIYVSVDLGVVEGVDDPVGLRGSDLSVALGIVTASRLAGADLCGVVPGSGGVGSAAALAARLAADLVGSVACQRA